MEQPSQSQQDHAAALRLIADAPGSYPVIRNLPDALQARLEPAERTGRYAELARELIVAAMGAGRAMVRELKVSPDNDAMCERIELALILSAITEAVIRLERARADLQRALADSTRRHEERDENRWREADRFEAATGGRSLDEVLDSERRLEAEVALRGSGGRA